MNMFSYLVFTSLTSSTVGTKRVSIGKQMNTLAARFLYDESVLLLKVYMTIYERESQAFYFPYLQNRNLALCTY